MSQEIVTYTGLSQTQQYADRAAQMLAYVKSDVHTIRDTAILNDMRDKAESIRSYLQVHDRLGTAIKDAAESKIRIERQLGRVLSESVRPGNPQLSHDGTIGRLPDGITRNDSSRWQQIAGIDEDVFEAHIAEASNKSEPLTTTGILRLAKQLRQPGKQDTVKQDGCIVTDLQQITGVKFGTIYADPPWQYGNQATRAATDNHYATMTVDEIAALPIANLAADYCHLHLWTTNAFIFECPKIIEAWGFKYQGMFLWCKPEMGIGNCWRVSHEILLLAIRGEPRKFLDGAHNLMSWKDISRGEHSEKPEEVRLMIERASPGPYLELFGRRAVAGWAVWGDEVSRDLFTQNIADLSRQQSLGANHVA